MRIHPAAQAIPEMLPDEFASLKADIEERGLLVPIEIYKGDLLDGRHRYRACEELEIEPKTVEVDLGGMSPVEYVWSVNGVRRHLTPGQRAAVAVQLLPELKREAEKRKLANLKRGQEKPVKQQIAERDKGQARDHAASLVGVNRQYVSDAEKLSNEAPDLFAKVRSGEMTPSKAKQEFKKTVKEKEDLAAAETAVRSFKTTEDNGVFFGDSFQLASSIPDASCALIFTDPPYDRDSLPMFDQLGELADRILVSGGSLITYCGSSFVPQVMESLGAHLHYLWPLCCLHTGQAGQMKFTGIKNKWKPMLWFVKGTGRRDPNTWVDDLVVSQQEKESHPWQQSAIEAQYYIERLTRKGELVVDPFCGSGTSAVAAKQLNRQWWTADVDARHVETARNRLNETDLQLVANLHPDDGGELMNQREAMGAA